MKFRNFRPPVGAEFWNPEFARNNTKTKMYYILPTSKKGVGSLCIPLHRMRWLRDEFDGVYDGRGNRRGSRVEFNLDSTAGAGESNSRFEAGQYLGVPP